MEERLKYSCGHNLYGDTVLPSDFGPNRQMPTSSGLCPQCVSRNQRIDLDNLMQRVGVDEVLYAMKGRTT